MFLSREEYFSKIHEKLGSDNSDDNISFIEDLTDTYNELEKRSKSEIDWEAKYNELNESWKTRYRHRFFSGDNSNIPTDDKQDSGYQPDTVTIEDLFISK